MKIVFKNKSEDLIKKIGYGTILLCKENNHDESFHLYKVESPQRTSGYTLGLLRDSNDYEGQAWGKEYEKISSLIADLKECFSSIQIVDAHIVIDNIVGEITE